METPNVEMGRLRDFIAAAPMMLEAMERCYRMLLSEPDTKGALLKTENILREAVAEAKATTHNGRNEAPAAPLAAGRLD